jgi:tRNA pseudouridine65 synthase
LRSQLIASFPSSGAPLLTRISPQRAGSVNCATIADSVRGVQSMKVLYRDASLIAVDKPAGLLVHRSALAREAESFALQRARTLAGTLVYPVHRLDRPTSGVLVFALSPELARELGERFAQRSVVKRYLAVVRGWTDERGTIDYPLRETRDPTTDALARSGKPVQPAITAFARLATAELPFPVGRYASARYSLLEIVPHTGRRHQIRRHLDHVAHPVIGDTTHGDGRHNAFFRARLDCSRLLLHASSIAFEHPLTGDRLEIRAPVDDAYSRAVAALGWTAAVTAYSDPSPPACTPWTRSRSS